MLSRAAQGYEYRNMSILCSSNEYRNIKSLNNINAMQCLDCVLFWTIILIRSMMYRLPAPLDSTRETFYYDDI